MAIHYSKLFKNRSLDIACRVFKDPNTTEDEFYDACKFILFYSENLNDSITVYKELANRQLEGGKGLTRLDREELNKSKAFTYFARTYDSFDRYDVEIRNKAVNTRKYIENCLKRSENTLTGMDYYYLWKTIKHFEDQGKKIDFKGYDSKHCLYKAIELGDRSSFLQLFYDTSSIDKPGQDETECYKLLEMLKSDNVFKINLNSIIAYADHKKPISKQHDILSHVYHDFTYYLKPVLCPNVVHALSCAIARLNNYEDLRKTRLSEERAHYYFDNYIKNFLKGKFDIEEIDEIIHTNKYLVPSKCYRILLDHIKDDELKDKDSRLVKYFSDSVSQDGELLYALAERYSKISDYASANKYLHKSALVGYEKAIIKCVDGYILGINHFERSEKEAFKLLNKLTKNNDTFAHSLTHGVIFDLDQVLLTYPDLIKKLYKYHKELKGKDNEEITNFYRILNIEENNSFKDVMMIAEFFYRRIQTLSGDKKDDAYIKAIAWFTKARLLNKEDPKAYYYIALITMDSGGSEKFKLEQAAPYIKKAIEFGSEDAKKLAEGIFNNVLFPEQKNEYGKHARMTYCYMFGIHVEKDFDKAIEQLNLALNQSKQEKVQSYIKLHFGYQLAIEGCDKVFKTIKEGFYGLQKYSNEDKKTEEAFSNVISSYLQCALREAYLKKDKKLFEEVDNLMNEYKDKNLNFIIHIIHTTKEYLEGLGYKQDKEKCRLALQALADDGSPYGLFYLGKAYYEGSFPLEEKDTKKGIYYLKKALLKSYSEALPYINNNNIDLTKD